MAISPELSAALRTLRKVRSTKPHGDRNTAAYAEWRERIAEALDSLAILLIYPEDREKAAAEAAGARAEAATIRAQLDAADE